MKGHTPPRWKLQLMTLACSSLQQKHGRYLLLWTGLLAAFPQPLGYNLNWKQVAETDGPWFAFNMTILRPPGMNPKKGHEDHPRAGIV